MSILSGFLKTKKHRKMADGNYQLQSEWTSASTVEMADGNTAETNLGAIQGITSSLATNNANYALSASAGKSLQDNITTANSNITTIQNNIKTINSSISTANSNITTIQNNIKTINSNISTINSNKSPIYHASTDSTYGIGTSSSYGHCKVVDYLATAHIDGVALSSYRGYLLNRKITNSYTNLGFSLGSRFTTLCKSIPDEGIFSQRMSPENFSANDTIPGYGWLLVHRSSSGFSTAILISATTAHVTEVKDSDTKATWTNLK